MSTIQRSSTSSMIDMNVLFAKFAHDEGQVAKKERDAAFEQEVNEREKGIAAEKAAAEAAFASGIFSAVGGIFGGGATMAAGGTSATTGQKGWEGAGQLFNGFANLTATIANNESAGMKAKAGLNGIEAEKAKKRRDDLNEIAQESRRLRDSFVSMMKQAIDDEKRVAEKIRG